jgi:hypothetical protein
MELKFRLLGLKCYTLQKDEKDMKMEIRTELNLPHENLNPTAPHSLET